MDEHKRLELAHYYFDELGYRPKTFAFSYKSFIDSVVDTLNHAASMEDSFRVLENYASAAPLFFETMRLANQNKDFWMSIPWKGTKDTNLLSNEESFEYISFTNIFSGDSENICFCGSSLPKNGKKNGLYSIKKNHGLYSVQTKKEPSFFFKEIKRKSQPAFLVLNNNHITCGLVRINSWWRPIVDNNNTDYEILVCKDDMSMVIYKRDYYESLNGKSADRENALALINYDCLYVGEVGDIDNEYEISLSRMRLLKKIGKDELLYLYAVSVILLNDKLTKKKRYNKFFRAIAPTTDYL